MKKNKKQNIEEYLNLPYSFIVTPEEDGNKTYYVCRIAELPGCLSHGKTPIEAQKNIQQAMYDWIETALMDGYEISKPLTESEKRITLRIPGTLETKIKLQAKNENKSLNQFIVDKLRYA
ncbi:MAG: type II toxin-antitoxin system HicB family antitoxin [Candidatus Melainabacteria bacterium]|nr:type II toxin-antitoxin system HicB family antitoxin [Candidatus Melainabacteria bacterium]